jgi:prephenate dehydratase
MFLSPALQALEVEKQQAASTAEAARTAAEAKLKAVIAEAADAAGGLLTA